MKLGRYLRHFSYILIQNCILFRKIRTEFEKNRQLTNPAEVKYKTGIYLRNYYNFSKKKNLQLSSVTLLITHSFDCLIDSFYRFQTLHGNSFITLGKDLVSIYAILRHYYINLH